MSTIIDLNRSDCYVNYNQLSSSKTHGKLNSETRPSFADVENLALFEDVEHVKVPVSHKNFQAADCPQVKYLLDLLDEKV